MKMLPAVMAALFAVTVTFIVPHPSHAQQQDQSLQKQINEIDSKVRRKLTPQALQAAKALVEAHPQNAAALATLGKMLLLNRKQQDGVAKLQAALAIEPDQPRASVWLAFVEFSTGQAQQATTRINKALNKHPNDIELLNFQADLLLQQKNFQQAVASLDKAITQFDDKTPDHVLYEVYIKKANIHVHLNEIGKAVPQYRKAYEHAPEADKLQAMSILVEAYAMNEQYDQAHRLGEKMIDQVMSSPYSSQQFKTQVRLKYANKIKEWGKKVQAQVNAPILKDVTYLIEQKGWRLFNFENGAQSFERDQAMAQATGLQPLKFVQITDTHRKLAVEVLTKLKNEQTENELEKNIKLFIALKSDSDKHTIMQTVIAQEMQKALEKQLTKDSSDKVPYAGALQDVYILEVPEHNEYPLFEDSTVAWNYMVYANKRKELHDTFTQLQINRDAAGIKQLANEKIRQGYPNPELFYQLMLASLWEGDIKSVRRNALLCMAINQFEINRYYDPTATPRRPQLPWAYVHYQFANDDMAKQDLAGAYNQFLRSLSSNKATAIAQSIKSLKQLRDEMYAAYNMVILNMIMPYDHQNSVTNALLDQLAQAGKTDFKARRFAQADQMLKLIENIPHWTHEAANALKVELKYHHNQLKVDDPDLASLFRTNPRSSIGHYYAGLLAEKANDSDMAIMHLNAACLGYHADGNQTKLKEAAKQFDDDTWLLAAVMRDKLLADARQKKDLKQIGLYMSQQFLILEKKFTPINGAMLESAALYMINLGFDAPEIRSGVIQGAYTALDYDKTIVLTKDYIKKWPDKSDLVVDYMAYSLCELKRYSEAIPYWTQLAYLLNDEESYAMRGYCYEQTHQRDKALADYTQAIKLGTRKKWVYESRCKLYERNGEKIKAAADAKKLGDMYRKTGSRSLSEKWYKIAQKILDKK